ncbi:hypothetical protein ERO13_A10G102376v2, partial [Gossypium hirsutum]
KEPLTECINSSFLITSAETFLSVGDFPKSRLGFLSLDSYGSASYLSLNYLPKLQPLNRLGIGTEIPMIFPQIQTFLFCCLPERRVWSSSPPTSWGQSLHFRSPCSSVISPPMNPLPSPNQR